LIKNREKKKKLGCELKGQNDPGCAKKSGSFPTSITPLRKGAQRPEGKRQEKGGNKKSYRRTGKGQCPHQAKKEANL